VCFGFGLTSLSYYGNTAAVKLSLGGRALSEKGW